MTGQFIVFEGGEGAGKSTQARMLADHLHDRGIAALLTREPGGTAGAEAIRELLLHPRDDGWSLESETLLFAAARSEHVRKVIRPALHRGEWVVCDRYLDSSRTYQGFAGDVPDDAILSLHEFGSGGLKADHTILLTLASEERERRLRKRDGATEDAISGRGDGYHARVAEGFNRLAYEDSSYIVVDGAGSPQDVHARTVELLEQRWNAG